MMFWIFKNLVTSWRPKDQANRLPWDAAGVADGNPVHYLLNAAQYIKLAWDSISNATIKNAFNFTSLN